MKDLLPETDIAHVIATRPSLLVHDEWRRVPRAARDLKELYRDDARVAHVVEEKPELLCHIVPAIVAELGRCAQNCVLD